MEIFDNRKIAISAYFVVMFVIPRKVLDREQLRFMLQFLRHEALK